MRGEVHILVYCPIDTLQWGSTHSALFIDIKVEESNRKLGLRSSQLSVQLQEATSMHNAKVIMMMLIMIMILMMVMMIMPVQRWL